MLADGRLAWGPEEGRHGWVSRLDTAHQVSQVIAKEVHVKPGAGNARLQLRFWRGCLRARLHCGLAEARL